MGDEELRYPEWQAPLEELVLERNPQRLRERMYEVETLIFKRMQQLSETPEGRDEREAINEALFVLRTIKHDKLGYPDWQN